MPYQRPVFCLLLAFTVTVLCGEALAQQARPRTLVDRIRQMKSAIVQIRVASDAATAGSQNGFPPRPFGDRAGTGFFVSQKGYVITAAHVVRESEARARTSGARNVSFKIGILLDTVSSAALVMRGSFSFVDATPVEIDEIHDIALLKLSQNPFTGEVQSGIFLAAGNGGLTRKLPFNVSVATLNPALPPEGKDVLVSGYPLDIPTLVTQKAMVASESFSAVDIPVPGAIPPGHTRTEVADSILLDAVVNPGNSGGPVYESESGNVIGICVAYENSPLFTSKQRLAQVSPDEALVQNSGLAVVVPIKYAIELLRKNSVTDFLTNSPHSRTAH